MSLLEMPRVKRTGWLSRLLGIFAGGRTQTRRGREFGRLLQLLNGDVAAAERLVAYEMRRLPGLDHERAAHRAADILVYDRSR